MKASRLITLLKRRASPSEARLVPPGRAGNAQPAAVLTTTLGFSGSGSITGGFTQRGQAARRQSAPRAAVAGRLAQLSCSLALPHRSCRSCHRPPKDSACAAYGNGFGATSWASCKARLTIPRCVEQSEMHHDHTRAVVARSGPDEGGSCPDSSCVPNQHSGAFRLRLNAPYLLFATCYALRAKAGWSCATQHTVASNGHLC